MSNDNTIQSALRREWAIARLVVIGGLIIAVAVAGYFVYRQQQELRAQQQAAAQAVAAANKKVDAKTLARVENFVCNAEIARAIDMGVVPRYAVLQKGIARAPGSPQRFICIAKTNLTEYFVSADLLCQMLAELRDPRCISLYRVATKRGLLVYARPE